MCGVAMTKCIEFGYELLSHPPYSPYLAHSDILLFSKLKKWFVRKKFDSNDGIITWTNANFDDLDKYFYLAEGKNLKKRWSKYMEPKEDYIEK